MKNRDYSKPENFLRLTKHHFAEETIARVGDVIRSGNLVQGEHVSQLESQLKEFLGTQHAILVSSGTAALHIALVALGIGPGDEVIVPAFTYPATANVVELVGAKSVIVDITLDDLCIDVSRVESHITPRTKAIMPVHEFGMPCDLAPLMEIANRHGIPVVEDAACSFGSEFKGKRVCCFGVMGCFSLHPRKAITTGEGGIVVTDSPELAKILRELRAHGAVPKDGRFDFVRPGFNYRLTEFQAVLGIDQLKEFDVALARRQEIAEILERELAPISWLSTPKTFDDRLTVWQSYHVLCDKRIERKGIISALRELGIESNLGAHALAHFSYYQQRYGLKETDFPNASLAYTHGLVLPIGKHMDDTDVEHLISSLRSLKV
jgi:dTDP-4-amino-4,6-dideoxygalactose transaminase